VSLQLELSLNSTVHPALTNSTRLLLWLHQALSFERGREIKTVYYKDTKFFAEMALQYDFE
jgi:hypothetical protein